MPLTLKNETKSKWMTVTMYLLRWWANIQSPQNSCSYSSSINMVLQQYQEKTTPKQQLQQHNENKQTNEIGKRRERNNTKEHQIHCTPQMHLQFITQRNRNFPVYSTPIEFVKCVLLFHFSSHFYSLQFGIDVKILFAMAPHEAFVFACLCVWQNTSVCSVYFIDICLHLSIDANFC